MQGKYDMPLARDGHKYCNDALGCWECRMQRPQYIGKELYGMQDAEQRASMAQQHAEEVRKQVNPLNHPLVQKYFER